METDQEEAIEESVEEYCESVLAMIVSTMDSLESAVSCETPSDFLQNLKDAASELKKAQKDLAKAVRLQETLMRLFNAKLE